MTEQEEFEFRARLEAEAAARANDQRPMSQRIAEDVGEDAVNPFFASGAGGIGAMLLGPSVEAGYQAATSRPGPTPGAASRLPEAGSPGQKWAAKTGYGSGPGESVRDVREHYVKGNAPIGQGKVSKKVSRATPGTVQAAVEQEQQQALEARIRAKNRPMSEKIASRTPSVVQDVGRGVGAGLEKFPRWAGRSVAGANLGYQGADAYNRALAGDLPGAATSGAGALGSTMFLLPGKYKKALGAGMAVGSHLLNRGMDEARENPEGYAKGRAVKGALEMFVPKATKNVRASEALGPHEGKHLYVTESDRMRSTDGDLGGPGFSKFQLEDPRYAEAKAAWGVGKKGKASEILNINKRFPEDKIIWSPLIGSTEQHRSNQHVYDRITDEFSRQASMGNLPQDLRQGMNERLAKFKDYTPMKLAGLDVANPEMLKQFGNTFEKRAAIAEVLGGKGMGGRKGQIFDYPGVIQEMTDPMVVGAPTHSVGTRLFSLTGDVEHRPDLHSAFPYILKGEDKGVAFSAVPKELMLSDWTNQVRDFIGRDPGYMDLIRGVKGGHGKPNQFISEEFLRNLEAAGHKEGGLAHLAGGGKAGMILSAGENALQLLKPQVSRVDMNFKDVTKRIPELQEAAKKMQAGEPISREEYEMLVNMYKPVTPYNFIPRPATRSEAMGALEDKEMFGLPSQVLQKGSPVGLRLDIPAYSRHGVWVPTIHEQAAGFGAGKKIGHESFAAVTDPTFGMSEKAALSIAAGKPKGTIATIKGNWNPMSEAEAVDRAQDYLHNPSWRQAGMDPERHGYFYDRANMEPIVAGEEALQVGPLVLVKKPKYGSKKDFKFKTGGLACVEPELK